MATGEGRVVHHDGIAIVAEDRDEGSCSRRTAYRRPLCQKDLYLGGHGGHQRNYRGGSAFRRVARNIPARENGSMRNLLLEDLHPAARLISHTYKRHGMMEGLDETSDAVLFIGYH